MEGFYPLKLKRKDLEDVNDDFSDFSLASPARKIRRLDTELPPVIEEASEVPIEFEHSLLQEQWSGNSYSTSGIRIEELPSEPVNEETAIVLFNPNTLSRSPSSFSISVNPHLISAFKGPVPWSNQSNPWRLADDEAAEHTNSGSSNRCLAVVPWVPSQFCSEDGPEFPCEVDNPEMMEIGVEEMDVEDGGDNMEQMNVNEGLYQWQQHCLIPETRNATPPIVWHQ